MTSIDQKAAWPGWNTVRLIGRGNFGAVYEIERDVFGHKEKAALKVITIPQSDSDIDELVSDGYDEESITARFESFLKDIVREYSLMADMKGCANIIYCDDVKYIQHDDGMGWDIFIKMELLTALPKALGKTVPEEQVIRVGSDICSALAFCEKRKLLHRDVKPQNIFVATDGTYKLGDFGIAKTAERTTSGTKTGTYKYMAPEVYKSQPYGGKADIYSLGLVLYWLLNERRTPFLPLPPATPTATMEDKARARRFAGEVLPPPAHGSEALKRIVLKACAYDPKDRYATAKDMLRELERLKDAPEEPEDAAPEAEKKNPPPVRDPWPDGDEDATVGIFREGSGSTGEKMTAGNPAEAEEGTVGIWQKPADAEPPEAPKAPKEGASASEAPKKEAPAADPGGESKDASEPDPAPEQPPAGTGKKKGVLWGLIGLAAAAVIGLILWKVIPSTRNEDPPSPSASGVALSAESPSPVPTAKPTPTPTPTPAPTPAPTPKPMLTRTLAEAEEKRIDTGAYFTVGLKSDGTVIAVGWNEYGQCDVSGWRDIVAVSAGGFLYRWP